MSVPIKDTIEMKGIPGEGIEMNSPAEDENMIGQRVVVETWEGFGNRETKVRREGTIIDVWYEPGDPVPGYTVRFDDGSVRGSLCASRCTPMMPTAHRAA